MGLSHHAHKSYTGSVLNRYTLHTGLVVIASWVKLFWGTGCCLPPPWPHPKTALGVLALNGVSVEALLGSDLACGMSVRDSLDVLTDIGGAQPTTGGTIPLAGSPRLYKEASQAQACEWPSK